MMMFRVLTPWCSAIFCRMSPSGYPYRFEYFQAAFMASIILSEGPYGFSLDASLARSSYGSAAGARPGGGGRRPSEANAEPGRMPTAPRAAGRAAHEMPTGEAGLHVPTPSGG